MAKASESKRSELKRIEERKEDTQSQIAKKEQDAQEAELVAIRARYTSIIDKNPN